ncbi:hypothetical protein LCGC14_2533030 [marine sediment metagenome]|uniref:HicB-like antitoxin of toxin-antitoxin system domain-containing protein n=1 Tax=marine sediment metagenome TaxID=412755 RepID=A0A0F9AT10_9ZZZZ
MKLKDARKGLLISKRDGSFFGEIIDASTRGTVIVLSYFDDCNHYINLRRLTEPLYKIEPDSGQFHAYIPFFKGCHTCGDTVEEAYKNLRDAIHAYIRSMRKHGEVGLIKHRWDNWAYKGIRD